MPDAALILAAGRGTRIRDVTSDKVLATIAGRPAIAYSVEAFLASGCVQTIAVVYRDEAERENLRSALSAAPGSASFLWIAGGTERQESVLAGLRALPEDTRHVFIHDAARPLVAPEAIRLLAQRVRETGAACLGRRVTDTIKQTRPAMDLAVDACVLRTIERSRLWAVETPQVFDRRLILEAYEKVSANGLHITDDTAALELTDHPISLVDAGLPNPKLTAPADLAYIEYLLSLRAGR